MALVFISLIFEGQLNNINKQKDVAVKQIKKKTKNYVNRLNKINRYNSFYFLVSPKVGLKENEIQAVCLNFRLSEIFSLY